jgi:tetrapyrrole methylase family protein/MazG family protein
VIRIVGLGPDAPEGMSVAAREALRAATCLILRTERHPAAEMLRADGLAHTTCDDLYETQADFGAVYAAIAERVLSAAEDGDVTYAVPGHPSMGEESVRLVLERAGRAGIRTEIVGSASFVEATLAAAGASLSDPLMVVDALSMSSGHGAVEAADGPRWEDAPQAALIVYQVHDADAAAGAKLALLETRPGDLVVSVVRAAGVPGQEHVERVPLSRLDRIRPDHLTSVYVPPVPPSRRTRRFADLVGVMARLRGQGGCPWDREQTHRSLRRWLTEECGEAIDAIDADDMAGLCEELGDVLLQIVFHAQIATESGAFTIDDVVHSIVAKLIRRHPHVFADAEAADPEAVVRSWEAIKKAEKGRAESALHGVPLALPALSRAQKMGERAAKVGFDWPGPQPVIEKLAEELAELRTAFAAGDSAAVEHEIGDLLFAAVNVARWARVDPEEALRSMLRRFATRFQAIEAEAARSGRSLGEMTLDEMDAAWERAKLAERVSGQPDGGVADALLADGRSQ